MLCTFCQEEFCRARMLANSACIRVVLQHQKVKPSPLERFPFKWTISGIREVCSAFSSRDLIET